MNPSDTVLLERWRHQRDAEAFAELVQRHAAMVFGTARRILADASLAEDVAQDVFLELMRFADAGKRIRTSMAGWLHLTASHRALNLIKSERRRRAREDQFFETTMKCTNDLDDLVAFVDEAIALLPEKLQTPFVAHFLEGLSHHEVSKQLGVPRTTATSRIARAIEQVRENLRRRGVLIGVSALASLLTVESTQAAPTTLIATLSKLALTKGGTVTAATVTGGIITMKVFTAAAIALIVGVTLFVGVIVHNEREEGVELPLVATVAQDSTEHASETQEAELGAVSPPSNNADVGITVSGRVVSTDGNPIPDVDVSLYYKQENMPPLKTVSDENGRFVFGSLKILGQITLLGKTEGLRHLPPYDSFELTKKGLDDIEIVMHRKGGVEGVVVDTSGHRLAGKPVTIIWLAEDGGIHFKDSTTTNAAGEFSLSGLWPGEQLLAVLPEDKMRHDTVDARVTILEGEVKKGLQLVHNGGGDFIAGRVTNESGIPLKGVFVQILHKDMSPSTYTDEQGRYRLSPLPRGPHRVVAVLNDGNAKGEQDVELGRADVDFVFEVPLPAKIAIRVVDSETGQPVTAFFLKLNKNTTAPRLSISDSNREFFYVKDPEGSFVIPSAPIQSGAVFAVAAGYALGSGLFHQGEDGLVPEVVIALEPQGVVEGVVVDTHGNPVEGAYVFGPIDELPEFATFGDKGQFEENMRGVDNIFVTRTDENGRFGMTALSHQSQTFTAFHYDLGRGSTEVTPQAEPTIITPIVLGTSGSLACFVSMDGMPLRNAGIDLLDMAYSEDLGHALTDENGYCLLNNLAAGALQVHVSPRNDNSTVRRALLRRGIIIEPGKTTELDVEFPSGNSGVQGMVKLFGEPAGGGDLQVLLNTVAGEEFSYAPVEASGDYIINGLPAGDGFLTAHVTTDAGERLERTISLKIGEGETVIKNIDFSGRSAIVGQVMGVPPEERGELFVLSGNVSIPDPRLGEFRPALLAFRQGTATIKTNGPYRITNLSSGTYTVLAYIAKHDSSLIMKDEPRIASQVVQLEEGEELNIDFDFSD